MTREELIHFMEWWDKRYYPSRLQFHREKDADKYLAEHSIPPAEGAGLTTRESLIKLIIDHSTGATDNIADGVWYKLLADEILKRQSIPANNGIPTREENPKGLHQRYIVSKTDGEPVDDKAEYFVLRVDKNGNDPKHIAACRKAVIVYANAIKDHLPELSKDLIARYSDGEPTAEGAEEITAKKYLSDHGYGSGTNFSSGLVAALMQEFATLHARKMARENNELQELMNNISEWSDKTFGHSQRNPAIIYHLKKEVDELIAAIEKTNTLGGDPSVGVGEFGRQRTVTRVEYADCLMLLLDSAHHFGISAKELLSVTRGKLEINKVRKWGSPDENGVVEHIE